MTFTIEFTLEAANDLRSFRKFDQEIILRAIEEQLRHQPDIATRNRKPLRPNSLSQLELRIDHFRAFYNVDGEQFVARIVAIGYKVGSKLMIRGQEYEL